MEAGNAAPSELKKSRLEALDRRHSVGSSPATAAITVATPGKFGSAPMRGEDTSAENPPYALLSKPIFDGEAASHLKLAESAGKGVVTGILRNLWAKGLQNSRKVEKKEREFQNKSNQVYVLDNPAKSKQKSIATQSSQRWSLRKHRRMGTYALDSQYRKYDIYVPLHEMWKDYIKKLIDGCNQQMLQSRLLTAELHGAPMEVIASKLCGFVGIKGLMIRETENTFGIITLDNKFKVVPKRRSIFVVYFGTMKITFFGNNLSAQSDKPYGNEKRGTTVEL